MSGTSMDGIDASLINTDGRTNIREISSVDYKYSTNSKILFKAAELAVSSAEGNLSLAADIFLDKLDEYLRLELKLTNESVFAKITTLRSYLADEYSQKFNLSLDGVTQLSTFLHAELVISLLQKAGMSASDIAVIGYHGQTMYHNALQKVSLQIGDGELLSELTKIKVITNFRENDLKFGGQGAPFAPLYHQALAVRDAKLPLIVVNYGGIANISVVYGPTDAEVFGFDTGPGNTLIDRFIKQRTRGAEVVDYNGKYGKQGTAVTSVLEALYTASAIVNGVNFYTQKPPKSLDSRDLKLVPELDKLSIEDGAATLEAFTAQALVESLAHLPLVPETWVLSGGGVNNPVILQQLKGKLRAKFAREFTFNMASDFGWNTKSLEAQIFAYLAVRSLHGMPLSLPSITGVAYPVTGGEQYNS